MSASDDLDALVRRADPDRWLAGRFAASEARASLVALYAFNHELARAPETASNALMGEIRLAWWREGVETLFAGGPARHPALEALRAPAAAGLIAQARLEGLIEARHAELEPAPFADEPALLAHIDATAGALMAAAAGLLGGPDALEPVRGAGRAWGWAGLLRSETWWAARGRRWTPASWGEAEPAEIAAHVRHRVEGALSESRAELAELPVKAFPAVAYAALARAYAAGRDPGELGRRATLVWASVTGRL